MLGPYTTGEAITKSDTVNFSKVSRGLWIGGVGDVTIVMAGGGTLAFVAVPAGTELRVRAIRVNSTGTSATNMVALW